MQYFSYLTNMFCPFCTFTLVYIFGVVTGIDPLYKAFDDTIIFDINWTGNIDNPLESIAELEKPKLEDPLLQLAENHNKEVMKVITSNKEKYECYIPAILVKETPEVEEYDGPSPLHIIKPLFDQKICSYRLESYWSYEICHGRYIRQYHEERDGKHIKTQEFYLGHWSLEKQLKLEAEMKAAQENKQQFKQTKVDGNPLPYIEVVMEDGTLCDLNGKPRLTRVKYVCYKHGKHEVYSFKEISTCEYEIIILSQLLCEHPGFKPKEVGENLIHCAAKDGAPKKPKKLMKRELESLDLPHNSIRLLSDKDTKDMLAVFKVEKIDKDGQAHVKIEFIPLAENEDSVETKEVTDLSDKPLGVDDETPIISFLNGDYCLNGGSGWWKYEFCYGKNVSQYHIDRSGQNTTVLLGKFDEQTHLDWIKANKAKAPKPIDQRTSVSHFYSNGDVCDKTGERRQTEVKLKCMENSSTTAKVSLYLLEPRTCNYILGVESPLICKLLPLADENGLIKKIDVPKVVKREVEESESVDETEAKVVAKDEL